MSIPICPKCGGKNGYRLRMDSAPRPVYACADCRHAYTELAVHQPTLRVMTADDLAADWQAARYHIEEPD